MFVVKHFGEPNKNGRVMAQNKVFDSHKETAEFIKKHAGTGNLIEIWHVAANFGTEDLECQLAERVYPAIDENDPPDIVWTAMEKAKVGETVTLKLANKQDFLYGNRNPMTFTILSATRFA